MSTRRKMLAADEDLANKIVDIAQRRGSTVFQTVNDVLEQAIRADSMGVLLSDVVNDREVLERAKKTGFTFTIEKLLYDMVDVAYEIAKQQITDIWQETGRWYGEYFKKRSNDGIDEFKEAMRLMTFGTSEFNVEKERDGRYSVSCVGERFTPGFTEAFGHLIEGVFNAFGFELDNKEVSMGAIRLGFRAR